MLDASQKLPSSDDTSFSMFKILSSVSSLAGDLPPLGKRFNCFRLAISWLFCLHHSHSLIRLTSMHAVFPCSISIRRFHGRFNSFQLLLDGVRRIFHAQIAHLPTKKASLEHIDARSEPKIQFKTSQLKRFALTLKWGHLSRGTII